MPWRLAVFRFKDGCDTEFFPISVVGETITGEMWHFGLSLLVLSAFTSADAQVRRTECARLVYLGNPGRIGRSVELHWQVGEIVVV